MDEGDAIFSEPNRKPEPIRFRDFQNDEYMDLHHCRLSDDMKSVLASGIDPEIKFGEPLRAREYRVNIEGTRLEDQPEGMSLAQLLDLGGDVRFYITATGGTGFISGREADRLIEAGFVRFVVE